MNKIKQIWKQYKTNKKTKDNEEILSEICKSILIKEKGGKLWIVGNGIGTIELEETLTVKDCISMLEEVRLTAKNYYSAS
jgi:hypothetical protein